MSDWMDAEAHADRALELYERGRWAEAEAELRKALSLNPDQAEWHFNLGLTLEQAGRDREALSSYERATELMPDETAPLLAAGVVANRLEQFERAIGWLDQALGLDPKLEPAHAHKIESLTRLHRHDDAETTFYIAQQTLSEPSAQCLAVMAESLIERELHARAEWCLKEALRLEPNMPRLRARLAAVSAAIGKPQRAVQLYLRELREDPGSIDTLYEYGELLSTMGRLPEAAEKFRRILELEPANVDAHFQLGLIALQTRRFEQAHLEFELVLKLDLQYPGIRPAMGEALLRRGRVDEARRHLIEEFESVKSAWTGVAAPTGPSESDTPPPRTRGGTPPGHQTMEQLATLLLDAHEPKLAAELLERAVTMNQTPQNLRQLALARFRSGDQAGGMAISRRVLRLDPHCLRSMHNLALAALEQGQVQMAAGWVKRGMRINRHDEGLRRLRIRVGIVQIGQFFKWLFSSN